MSALWEPDEDGPASRLRAFVGCAGHATGWRTMAEEGSVAYEDELTAALFLADLRDVLGERDLWRERAFTAFQAAMEPEEGAEVQWQATNMHGWWLDAANLSADDIASLRAAGRRLRRRIVGPWTVVPPEEES